MTGAEVRTGGVGDGRHEGVHGCAEAGAVPQHLRRHAGRQRPGNVWRTLQDAEVRGMQGMSDACDGRGGTGEAAPPPVS